MLKYIFNTRGATAIEYALIAVGIALAILTAVSTVGDTLVTDYYNEISLAFKKE